MVKSNLLTSISLDIDTFKAHLKRMSKEGYSIHKLDKDLLLQKTRDLYDNISQMEVMGGQHLDLPEKVENKVVETPFEGKKEAVQAIVDPAPEKIKETENIASAEIRQQNMTEENISIETAHKADTSVIIDFEDVSDLKSDTETFDDGKETLQEEELRQEEKEQPVPESTYDLFSATSETLSDKFATTEEKSIADKLKLSKLEDLRSAIGINEKFLFINELFNGDMSRYNKALDELNSMQNKTGVDTYIMELKIEKQWNDDDDAFIKFKELVDRKFN
ncbi:MAG: hypothetical protein GXO88_14040 [Chlorobi bacterium]|nr:hypothetical protein [Chlorobiota bacterium]